MWADPLEERDRGLEDGRGPGAVRSRWPSFGDAMDSFPEAADSTLTG